MLLTSSLVRTRQNAFFLTAVSTDSTVPNVSILTRDNTALNFEYSVSSRDDYTGYTEYAYELANIIGLVWEIVLVDSNSTRRINIGEEADVDGDDIVITQGSSTEIIISRRPKEQLGEEYPNPRISNGRNSGAAVYLYPVISNPSPGYYRTEELPKYIAYLNPQNDGNIVRLHAELNDSSRFRLITPSLADGWNSLYEVIPFGVLIGGGNMASYESQTVLQLNVGGAI